MLPVYADELGGRNLSAAILRIRFCFCFSLRSPFSPPRGHGELRLAGILLTISSGLLYLPTCTSADDAIRAVDRPETDTWMEVVTGGRNVDFSQGFRKPALFYQQSHDPAFLEASEQKWDGMMGIYGQVPGGMFGGDEFARPGDTDPRQAIETCGAVEMMFSHEVLLRTTCAPKWADRCEAIAFNTLPASMTANLKALRYLTSPDQVNPDRRSKDPGLVNGTPMQAMDSQNHCCCQHNAGFG